MAGRLDGKVCMITGGAGALGQAIARHFAEEGAQLILTDRDEAAGAAAAAAWGAHFLAQDVTDEAQWGHVMGRVSGLFGRLDVLVNCAGWEGQAVDTFAGVDLADWRRVMAINVEGTLLGCRAAMPVMRAQQGGSIINLSSLAGLRPTAEMVSYGASKAAVKHLTLSVAAEGAPHGVRCNAIHPGQMDTPMLSRVYEKVAMLGQHRVEDVRAGYAAPIPLRRLGLPEDIAHGAVYLASDESSYITGISLRIDGGMTLV